MKNVVKKSESCVTMCIIAALALAAQSPSPGAPVTINASGEKWIRQADPGNAGFDNDLISVWSTAANDGGGANARYGLVEFNISGLSGATLQSAKLRLYSFVTGSSSDGIPIKQSAYLISSVGTPLLSLSWNLYQSEKDAGKQTLETLGRYDLPPVGSTPGIQDVYVESVASAIDLALIQSELDGDGIVTLVLIADEDSTDYRADWGDAGYAGLKPQLVLDDGSGCVITTTSLTAALEGEPYSQTVQQDGTCTNPSWSVISGALPTGLSLNGSTGEISGTPDGDGDYDFTVQVVSDAGTRSQELSLTVLPFTGFIIIPATVDTWISESFTPGVTREDDFISVYSSAANAIPPGRRVGLVQWDVSSLAGKTLTSGRISLLELSGQSSAPLPMKQVAYLLDIDTGGGDTPLGSLTWNSYLAEHAGNEVPFESLGEYDLGPTLLTRYVDSALASSADLTTIQNAANSPSGVLNVALWAVEDGTDYRIDWGDAGLAGAPPLLQVDDGTACRIIAESLPDGEIGTPYTETLSATAACTGTLSWSLTDGVLPDGMALNGATGEISGTPTVAGVFEMEIRMDTSEGRFRRTNLSINVPGGSTGQVPASGDVWVRYNTPDNTPPYENDLISVWSSFSGDPRVGLIEFDLSSLAGADIVGAQLSLYATRADDTKQAAVLVPTGPTSILGTTWELLQSEKLAGAQAFDRFGRYELAPGEGQGSYVNSLPATAADISLIEAEATGDGKLTLALVADEDGNDYRQDWGDAYNVNAAPLLIIQLGGGCVVLTASLPNGTHGAPYSVTLQATPDCGTSPLWAISDCYLPAGLTLDTATGTISGLPALGGDFDFQVQTVPSGASADLSIHIQPSPADLDGDQDVDLDDAGLLMAAYSGPGGCDVSAAGPTDAAILAPTFDAWMREEGSPGPGDDFVRDGDLISVWSSDFGPTRYGLMQFDVSQFAGQTLASVTLELYNPVTGYSGDDEPILQTAYVIDTTGGTPMGSGLNWGVYQAEYEGNETTLQSLGAYDAGATSTTPEIQDVYLPSYASANDIAVVQAAANSASGTLNLIFKQAENATGYKADWGDIENTLGSLPARLIVEVAGDPCRIETLTLPAGSVGQAYSSMLTADGNCTGTLQWAISSCTLPPGLTLNAGTGEISGTPALGGSYPLVVELTADQGTRKRILTLDVSGRDADFDNDGDVDLVDLDYFALRMGGSFAPAPSCTSGGNFPSTDTPLNIPDADSVISTLHIASSFTIGDANVFVDVSHGFQRFLKLELEGPDGTRIVLKDFLDGAEGEFPSTTFDDEGTAPAESLSAFDGKDAMGDWKLIASDYDVVPDNAVLNAWTLILSAP